MKGKSFEHLQPAESTFEGTSFHFSGINALGLSCNNCTFLLLLFALLFFYFLKLPYYFSRAAIPYYITTIDRGMSDWFLHILTSIWECSYLLSIHIYIYIYSYIYTCIYIYIFSTYKSNFYSEELVVPGTVPIFSLRCSDRYVMIFHYNFNCFICLFAIRISSSIK